MSADRKAAVSNEAARESGREAVRSEMNRALEKAREGSATTRGTPKYSGDISVGLIFANGHQSSATVGR